MHDDNLHEGNGVPDQRHRRDGPEGRLDEAVAQLRREPLPVAAMRRALARAERLSEQEATRSGQKTGVSRKPRLPGFDHLEDRRALSAVAWDACTADIDAASFLDGVAVVTTESMQPVLSSYSTLGFAPDDANTPGVGSGRWSLDPLLRSDVQVAAAIDLERVSNIPGLEEILGSLVN